MSRRSERVVIVAAVNDESILRQNLLASPDVQSGAVEVLTEKGHKSAASAYNAGLARVAGADVIAFVHQDVYLPLGWLARIGNSLNVLDQASWALAGVWGVRQDGQFVGRVWCSGGGKEHVGLAGNHEIESLDEIVLLVNMRYGLWFDEALPGFHLYATDLILEARRRSLKAYCVEAPVIHNSKYNLRPLDHAYRQAYRYMQRKWWDQLPVKTCVVDITKSIWPLYRRIGRHNARYWRAKVWPSQPSARVCDDPVAIARRLGYEAV